MVTTVTCDRFITRLFIKLLNLQTRIVELGYSNTVFIESIKDFKYYKILIKSWRISRKMITFAPAK